MIEIDDGHKPGGCTDVTKCMIDDIGKVFGGEVKIFDEVLPEVWRDRAYHYSTNIVGNRPWGVQVHVIVTVFEL